MIAPLIDSDVLVWLTRGHVGAALRLQALEPWRISVVTYIELAQGCRDKAELARLKKGLAARNTDIVPITPTISDRAAELIDRSPCRTACAWPTRSSARQPSRSTPP
jgi:predicted nucleic acid-binding protein